MIAELRAFAGGYCRQLLAMVDRRSWRIVRFPAVFLALRHVSLGWVLIDTGYGGRFEAATRRLPFRFYRWATPVVAATSTAELLAAAGIRKSDVRHVIVTHFHADHIGGCGEFPAAAFHFRADALQPLRALPPLRQVRAAFLPELVPPWLDERANAIPSDAFAPAGDFPFATFDLFGDGSIRLVHLPGHAPGQVGVAFTANERRIFYVADAFWRAGQIEDGIEPLGIAMSFQWDRAAYRETVRRLRDWRRRSADRIVACHDENTCAALNRERADR